MFKSRLNRLDLTFAALLLLGLAIRVGYLLYYRSLPDWDQLTVDNNYHHHWAQSLAAGNWLGSATYFRAPGYVYCLGALYRVFGDSLWVGRLFGVAIGLASISLTYLTAKKIFSRRVALVAAAIQVICPIMIYSEGELLLDSLFALTVQICLYRTLIWMEQPSSKHLFWVGLTLGISAVVRPTSLVLLVVLGPLAFWLIRDWRLALRQMAFLAVAMLLTIGPIFLRNLVVAGDPVAIASQGGINFYIGNNPSADGLSATLPEPMGFNWRIAQITAQAEREAGHPLKPGEVSSYWSGLAWKWILGHPGSAAALYAKKLYFCFTDNEISNNRNMESFFKQVALFRYNPLTFAPILGLACVGLLLSWRRNRFVVYLAFSGLSLILFNALFFVNSRFRLPELPILITLAAVTLSSVLLQVQERRWKSVILALALAIVVATASKLEIVPLPRSSNAQVLNSQMLYYYARHEDRRALEYGIQAKLADSTFPEVNLNLGNIWLRAGKVDSAALYYRREIAANPARDKAFTNLASLYLMQQARDSSLVLIMQALDRQPEDPIANALLVRILGSLTSVTVDSLARAARDAVARSGHDIRVLTEVGSVLVQGGALTEAEPFLHEAVSAKPPPIETDDAAFDYDFPDSPVRFELRKAIAYYLLGYVRGRSGNFGEAIHCSREAIARDSSLVEAYVNLVSGYLSVGNADQADSTLALAIARFPQNQHLQQLSQGLDKMKRDRW